MSHRKTKQGLFSPKNPQKYRGDPTLIVYRSSWEQRFMTYLDENTNVLEWKSEEFYIPYYDPSTRRYRRYFPDFFVTVKESDGTTKNMVIEIKPKTQTEPPKPAKRVTKKLLKEAITWGVNNAKWEAAREYCSKRGWKFILMTEYDLGLK